MKKKLLIMAGIMALVLSVAAVSMAAPWGPGYGRGPSYGMGPGWQAQGAPQLTEAQKAEWNAWYEKNLQLRKEYVQNLVKSGILTQEQADARIKLMEANYNFQMKNGFVGPWRGMGAETQLTDAQKADLRQLFEQRLALRKQMLDSYVQAGQITQAQADTQLAWMKDRFELQLKYGYAGFRGGRGMGRMGPRM